ncbi:MAG: hypothetical protein JXR76_09820 [Deltaproteobacteria bacterium]|nr:hypothetical protein [Deltaproteobacteria bacterium]
MPTDTEEFKHLKTVGDENKTDYCVYTDSDGEAECEVPRRDLREIMEDIQRTGRGDM